jgi:hypothetical protein
LTGYDDPLAPVTFEIARHLGNDRADGEYIEICEQHATRGAEVLIPDIAASDDRRLIVGRERLDDGRVQCSASERVS